LKQQLISTTRKEELARQEMDEHKKSAAAYAASLTAKLKTAQNDKLELEAALEKVGVANVIVRSNFCLTSSKLRM